MLIRGGSGTGSGPTFSERTLPYARVRGSGTLCGWTTSENLDTEATPVVDVEVFHSAWS